MKGLWRIVLVGLVSLAGNVSMFYPMLAGAAEPMPGVTIYYEENAQVELINAAGTRILIDVYRPDLLSGPATEKDILLTTHAHQDHVNADFLKTFPGIPLNRKAGEIKFPDVVIRGLASAHNAADPLLPEGGTNYIFMIDLGGLRIAHFGDIGQDALTPEQLQALGKVDIAITQLDNSFSSMNAGNQKGFHLMDQVRPRLIIPTHNAQEATKMAVAKWAGVVAPQKSVTITPADLSDQPRILFMGMLAPAYQKLFNLPTWEPVKQTGSCDKCQERMRLLSGYNFTNTEKNTN